MSCSKTETEIFSAFFPVTPQNKGKNMSMDRTVRGVTTYGTETRVDDSSISRLSFYLKCCTVGCGLAMNIDPILMDYNNARFLPGQIQRAIFELSLHALSPELLLNRAYFLDNNHTLLPVSASNAFFEIETASRFFPIGHQLLLPGQTQQVHKVMLCTSAWLEECYFQPLQELQQAARAKNSTLSGPFHISFHCTHCRGTCDVCTCESGCPRVGSQCHVVHKGVPCSSCAEKKDIHGHRYHCTSCGDINLCASCYDGGVHDHTHAFVKFKLVGSLPIIVAPRVESLPSSSLTDMAHEVPTADAIQINDCKACEEQGEALGQTFWPGQTVRLIGLSTAHMNGRQALVLSVTNDMIHVHLLEAGETETYSVKSENLAAVQPSHAARTSASPLVLR